MNEQELLNQLQTGNESAFKTLVETHQKRVFTIIKHQLLNPDNQPIAIY